MKRPSVELQDKCEHRDVRELGRSPIEDHRDGYVFVWPLVHLQCARCFKLFGRDDWASKRKESA